PLKAPSKLIMNKATWSPADGVVRDPKMAGQFLDGYRASSLAQLKLLLTSGTRCLLVFTHRSWVADDNKVWRAVGSFERILLAESKKIYAVIRSLDRFLLACITHRWKSLNHVRH